MPPGTGWDIETKHYYSAAHLDSACYQHSTKYDLTEKSLATFWVFLQVDQAKIRFFVLKGIQLRSAQLFRTSKKLAKSTQNKDDKNFSRQL